jgi:hypothetical protein
MTLRSSRRGVATIRCLANSLTGVASAMLPLLCAPSINHACRSGTKPSPRRPQFPEASPSGTVATSSSLICGHFQFITADIHAAPPTRAFLARIEEMKDTRLAFANTRRFKFCKQVSRGISDRRPKICRLARLEDRFPDELRITYIERRTTRVFTQGEMICELS